MYYEMSFEDVTKWNGYSSILVYNTEKQSLFHLSGVFLD